MNLFRRSPKIKLNVVIYKEEDYFVAHCLQMDIVTTGETPEEAQKNMDDLIRVQVSTAFENDNLEHLFRSAPKEIWQRFIEAKKARKKIKDFSQLFAFESLYATKTTPSQV